MENPTRANALTVAKPSPNGSGLGLYPDLSPAIFRHVGNVAGTCHVSHANPQYMLVAVGW